MRRGFAGNLYAASLGFPYQRHAFFRGNVADMVAAAGSCGQSQVAGNLPPFTLSADALVSVGSTPAPVVDIAAAQQRIVFAVSGQDAIQFCGPPHRFQHNLLPLYAAPVSGKGDAMAAKRCHVDNRFAPPPQGDGSVREHLDAGIPVDNGLLQRQRLRAVGRRVEVGHCADGRVSAPCRRQRTGPDGLFLRRAGLPEMHVQIGQAIGKHQPRKVHDFSLGRTREVYPHSLDNAVGNQHVSLRENPVFRAQRGAFQ